MRHADGRLIAIIQRTTYSCLLAERSQNAQSFQCSSGPSRNLGPTLPRGRLGGDADCVQPDPHLHPPRPPSEADGTFACRCYFGSRTPGRCTRRAPMRCSGPCSHRASYSGRRPMTSQWEPPTASGGQGRGRGHRSARPGEPGSRRGQPDLRLGGAAGDHRCEPVLRRGGRRDRRVLARATEADPALVIGGAAPANSEHAERSCR
jgi:hypothetical protein